MDQPETHRSNVPDGMNVVDNDKSIAKTEAPVICFVESGAVSVVRYHRTLVSCSSVKEAIMAVMSTYFVCNTEYDAKHKLLTSFIEFILTGRHVQLAKRATLVIARWR